MQDQLTNRIHRFVASSLVSGDCESKGLYAVATTPGLVRKENQDCAIVVTARYGETPDRDFDIAVVCDGLGGMKHGREAALLGLSSFVSKILRTSRVPAVDRVRRAIDHANLEIFNVLRGGGGTTLSAVVIFRSGLTIVGHAGDSRVYAVSADELRQLSQDDTLGAALKRTSEQEDLRKDSRLLQFVGMGEDLQPHIFTAALPDVWSYVLTTDGAHDLPHSLLLRTLSGTQHNPSLARKLVQISESFGGADNATVAIVPARVPPEEGGKFEGLDLMLLNHTGRLDIWIPLLADDKREYRDQLAESMPTPPAGEQGGTDAAQVPVEQSGTSKPPKSEKKIRERKKARKKSARTKGGSEARDQLPFSENVDIRFPENGDKE